MTITIYKTNKDNRCIDKVTGATVLTATPLTIKVKDKISLLAPIFEIDYNSTYLTANYLYCDALDRYYYIREVRVNTAQRLELVCEVDVRQSFKTSILNSECTILRAGGLVYPTQIIDNQLPVNPSRKEITSILLPEVNDSFGTDKEKSYLLTVVGGEPNITP